MGRDTIILFFALLLAGCASPNGAASDRIEGRVVAIDSSDPLPQVRVRLELDEPNGQSWRGVDTTNASGRFAIDALTNPTDYSSTLLQRDREYTLVTELDGYWVHTQTVSFSRRLQEVAVVLTPKDHQSVDGGGGAQQQDGPLLGNGGSVPKRDN